MCKGIWMLFIRHYILVSNVQWVIGRVLNIAIVVYCVSLDPQPVGVQCPLTPSPGEGVRGHSRLPYVLVFFHLFFFTCHWISFVFLLYDWHICIHLVDPSLTHFLGFQAWDWLWYPMLWPQRRSRGAQEAEILFEISALPGFGPQTLAANVTTRLLHTLMQCSMRIYRIFM